MKASDTVMDPEEIWKMQQGNCYWKDVEKGKAVAEAQAEISFKAGINEVDNTCQISEQMKNMQLIEGVPAWIAVDWKKWQALRKKEEKK